MVFLVEAKMFVFAHPSSAAAGISRDGRHGYGLAL